MRRTHQTAHFKNSMRYSFSESVQSWLFSVGFTGALAWPLALMIEDVSPRAGQIIACVLLVIGIIHLALYFNTHRWARVVLSVTGIAWIYRNWLEWRIRGLTRKVGWCRDAIEYFQQTSAGDLRTFYREILRRAHFDSGLPTFEELDARARSSMPDRITWSRMQYEQGAHLAYEEGKFDAGAPDYTEYWNGEVHRALHEALNARAGDLANLKELLTPGVAEA